MDSSNGQVSPTEDIRCLTTSACSAIGHKVSGIQSTLPYVSNTPLQQGAKDPSPAVPQYPVPWEAATQLNEAFRFEGQQGKPVFPRVNALLRDDPEKLALVMALIGQAVQNGPRSEEDDPGM